MKSRSASWFVGFSLWCISIPVVAQDQPGNRVPATTPPDTTAIADTSRPALDTTLQKYLPPRERNEPSTKKEVERKPALPHLSIIDSVLTSYISDRLNERRFIDQSSYHDAGDYARHDPAFFAQQYYETPVRSTVAPFGLAGNRLDIIRDHSRVEPFDHVIEPDGMVDMNDLPTATDDAVLLIPGPAGQLFGSDQAIASMITRAVRPDSSPAISAFLVDKGAYGFSHARARYAKRFTTGKDLALSLDYRLADGGSGNFVDNTYHYTVDFLFPIGENCGVSADGWIYDRGGRYPLRPDTRFLSVERNRIDRHLNLGFFRQNTDHSRLDQITYRHLRQGVFIGNDNATNYKSRFNLTGHGFTAQRDLVLPTAFVHITAYGDYLRYDHGTAEFTRVSGGASLDFAQRKVSGWRYGAHAKLDYTESFRPNLDAAALLLSDSPTRLYQLSVGLAEKVPSLHELYSPLRVSNFYGNPADYTEHGNPDLKLEHQLVASAQAEFGPLSRRIGLTLTGGRLFDAIDWLPDKTTDAGIDRYNFSPINHDLSFADATLRGEWQWRTTLQLHGGASGRYQHYSDRSDWPYTPNYQLFGGGELHYYWAQKLMHFYAYGEVVYVGAYSTYSGDELAATPVFNSKLSFTMGNFRFNLTYLNTLANAYESREDLTSIGRLVTWGFIWNFFD